jgi:hypothetical protein
VNHASAVRQAKASGIAVAILRTSVFNGWALTCATLLVAAKAQHVQCVLNETPVLFLNNFTITCKYLCRCKKNQPSGVHVQYRADRFPAPCAEHGSIEVRVVLLKIFQHHWQNLRWISSQRFACSVRGQFKRVHFQYASQYRPFWGCVLSTSPATLWY